MIQIELQKYITETVKKEMRKQYRIMHGISLKNTKELLSNYNKYKRTIKFIDKTLNNLSIDKISKWENSKDTELVQSSRTYKSDLERLEDKIESLKENKSVLLETIAKIDNSLNVIKNDKYYYIITCKYFKEMDIDEITQLYKISKRTYHRNHSRLLSELRSILDLDL